MMRCEAKRRRRSERKHTKSVFSRRARFCRRDIKMKKVKRYFCFAKGGGIFEDATLAFVVKTDLFCCQHFFTLPKTAHLLLTLLLLLLPATTTDIITEL